MDDVGLHDGNNLAALHLVQIRRVHARGCMVGAPAWTAAWQAELRAVPAHQVDIGLHLDLTEYPLSAALRRPLPHWIAAAYAHRLPVAALRADIRAQLDAFEATLGRPPAYIDGHQHVHQLPGIRTLLVEEINRRYSAHKPWLRRTQSRSAVALSVPGGTAAWAKAKLIAALGSHGLARLAQQAGIAQNRALLGVYGFDADRKTYLALLAAALQSCCDGDLVMCHPSALFGQRDPIAAARQVEFEVLRSEALGGVLSHGGFALQPMGRILSSTPQTPLAES